MSCSPCRACCWCGRLVFQKDSHFGVADGEQTGLETGGRLEIRCCRSISNLQSLISNLSLLFVLITCLYADSTGFINPAFTKDEWRDVAAFLHARIRPDETVILVSGHARPVWHY